MKTISDWNGVKAESVLAGSPAQAFNVMSDMLTDLRKYETVNAKLVSALEDCAELIELERGTKGCSGPGDHRDRHADAEWSGSSEALSKAYAALTKAGS
jgi:hypothetical protein